MKEALHSMIKVIMMNETFLTELSADVSALKVVVSALGPKVREELDKQMDVEHDKIQQQIQKSQQVYSSLRRIISKMTD